MAAVRTECDPTPDDAVMTAGDTTRWLITGAGGMLGTEVARRLRALGAEVVATDRDTLDVGDPDAVRRTLTRLRPHVVVNCAAHTQVEAAEECPADAMRVNADGPAVLAEACAAAGGRLVHVSTDHVFPGDGSTPYAEDDPPDPRTAHGRSKLAGEHAVLQILPLHGIVVRTAWLYSVHGSNFVRTMLRLEADRETVRVVDDQYGQPTWAREVAGRLVELGRHRTAAGVFHATATGQATWYEFAREVFRLRGTDPDRVRPVSGRRVRRAAHRPAYTVLGHRRWDEVGIAALPDWRESLARVFGLDRAGDRRQE